MANELTEIQYGSTTYNIKDQYALHYSLEEVIEMIYPIGTIYQTTLDDYDPNAWLPGTWERITRRFLWGGDPTATAGGAGVTIVNPGDGVVKPGTIGGLGAVSLTSDEVPLRSHTHTVPGHTHTVTNGGVIDYSGSKTSGAGSQHRHQPSNTEEKWITISGTAKKNKVKSGTDTAVEYINVGATTGTISNLSYTNYEQTHTHSVNISHGHGFTQPTVNGGSCTTSAASVTSAGGHNNIPPYLAVNIWKRTA